MTNILSPCIPNGYSMKDFFAITPELENLLNRKTPSSYEVFVNQIDKDLNNIISITESGRQHHLTKDEDAITEHIIVQLKHLYASVHHDAQIGGHCDIYIEVTSSNGELYKWIMEAKIWNGFKYVYSGLNDQLLGSYAVGGIHSSKGGMIFYSRQPKGAKSCMDEWYQGLETKGIIINNKRQDSLRFDTVHKLNGGSGADFFVNHYCIELYHAPTQAKLDKAKAKAK